MRWFIGMLMGWLAAAPAWGMDATCSDAGKAGTSPFYLSPPAEESLASRLLAEPAARPRGKGGEEGGVEFQAKDDLLSLVFSTPTVFRPWVGAGLDLGGLENFARLQDILLSPPPYRLGAGLRCELGEDLRLNLGYRYRADGPPPAEDPFGERGSEEGERHRFSFGLEKTF